MSFQTLCFDAEELQEASWAGHASVVKLLLDAKADVNARNVIGSTALMEVSENDHALEKDNETIVNLLRDAMR